MTKRKYILQEINDRFLKYENEAELTGALHSLLQQLSEADIAMRSNPLSMKDLVNARIQQLTDPKQIAAQLVKSEFEDFDNLVGGFIKGEMVVIGSRPGMGKTQWMVNLCVNMANMKRVCGFVSLELNPNLLANRFISNCSFVNHEKLAIGDLTQEETEKVKNAVGVLEKLPIYALDQFLGNLNTVLAHCRQLVNDQGVEVIFIDYLQLITAYSRSRNREAEVAVITRELKKLAKELNVVMIVSSQLSRQVESRPGGSKRPQLSDLRESGAIEQDADKVIFLYRPEYYGLEVDEDNESTHCVMEVIVAKNKTGKCDSFKLSRNQNFTAFYKYRNVYTQIQISQNRLHDLE